MNSTGYGSPVKRRKVRKGTRSCWACKHRKVRCIFAAPEDVICITCRRRKTDCVGQEFVEEPDTQQYRPQPGTGYANVLPSPAQSVGQHDDHSGRQALDVGTQQYGEVEPHATCEKRQPHADVLSDVTRRLIDRLPPQADVDIVLQKLNDICLESYAFKSQEAPPPPQRKGALITSAGLRCQDAHPTHLARHMLLLAIGMQHCCFKTAIPNLIEHPKQMADRLARSAIELVTANDSLLTSVESVDNIILESCFFTNKGDMQRAWTALRRAVTGAELVQFQQPGRSLGHEQQDPGQAAVWSCVQGMERLVSLLLGLPTSVPITEDSRGLNLESAAKSIPGRIIQRNDTRDHERWEARTREIETDLLLISEELSKVPVTAGSEDDYAPPDVQHLFHELCFHSMILQLHSPQMLFGSDEVRRFYATIPCVHAARALLTRQRELRKLGPIHPCCGMSDFMACVAGIILMLAHILGRATTGTTNAIALQRSGDRKLIYMVLRTIHQLSEKDEDSLVARSIQSLELLLVLDAQAASGQVVDLQAHSPDGADLNQMHPGIVIAIGAVGRITASRSSPAAQPDHGASLTLGGLGSLQIVYTPPPAEVSGPREVLGPDGSTSTAQHAGAAGSNTVASNNPWPQQDTLDHDWLFDGVLDASTFFDAFVGGDIDFNVGTSSF